ncbi:hypothetical protein D3C78_19600 [compost metagenome]
MSQKIYLLDSNYEFETIATKSMDALKHYLERSTTNLQHLYYIAIETPRFVGNGDFVGVVVAVSDQDNLSNVGETIARLMLDFTDNALLDWSGFCAEMKDEFGNDVQ